MSLPQWRTNAPCVLRVQRRAAGALMQKLAIGPIAEFGRIVGRRLWPGLFRSLESQSTSPNLKYSCYRYGNRAGVPAMAGTPTCQLQCRPQGGTTGNSLVLRSPAPRKAKQTSKKPKKVFREDIRH